MAQPTTQPGSKKAQKKRKDKVRGKNRKSGENGPEHVQRILVRHAKTKRRRARGQ